MTESMHPRAKLSTSDWQIRPASGLSRVSPATCEGLYFKSSVAYMPGDRLICCLEFPVDGSEEVTVAMEYEVEVLRIDSGKADVFGIACSIRDWRCQARTLPI